MLDDLAQRHPPRPIGLVADRGRRNRLRWRNGSLSHLFRYSGMDRLDLGRHAVYHPGREPANSKRSVREAGPSCRHHPSAANQSVLASAATSTRRLEVRYNRYAFIHISPLDEHAFMNALQQLVLMLGLCLANHDLTIY